MKLAPIFNPDARKPMPKPVRVDLRKVFLIGTALWLIALIVCLILQVNGVASERASTVCIAGIVLGLIMLCWEHFDRQDYRRLGQ